MQSDNGIEYAEIDVLTKHETSEAVLFDTGDVDGLSGLITLHWVPKSLLKDWPSIRHTGTALVQRWFAEKEGLI